MERCSRYEMKTRSETFSLLDLKRAETRHVVDDDFLTVLYS